MVEQKVAIMKLKVDLQCRKCCKKVKKVLCKYPQIRDQVYDEKHGIVTIRVVCCSPEKLRDNICCQGGGVIKSIEIVEPQKPKPVLEAHNKPKPNPTPAPAGSALPPAPAPTAVAKAPAQAAPAPAPAPVAPAPAPAPVASAAAPAVMYHGSTPMSFHGYPPPAVPVGLYYGGGPSGPPEVYGRPIYDSYGWNRPCYVGHHHHEYFCEEEASVCTIS